MDATLSQPVRLRLDKTLAQWRRWRPPPRHLPEPLHALEGGRSNLSVRVGDGVRDWVVRLDSDDPTRLGLDRGVEWRCLQRAAGAALAPQPVYRNPELGTLVCEYHEADAGPRETLEEIVLLLRQIHDLPPVRARLDPLARARIYARLSGRREELPEAFTAACDRLARETVPRRLCHNDLLRPNRLVSQGRLLALDWEYAAMGDPLFDLAVIIEGDGLDAPEAARLHCHWLGRHPYRADAARLDDQRQVYRCLAALWEQVPGAR